jgi:hypothetical protein
VGAGVSRVVTGVGVAVGTGVGVGAGVAVGIGVAVGVSSGVGDGVLPGVVGSCERYGVEDAAVFWRPLPISWMYAKIPPAKKKITAARANRAGGDNAIFGSVSLRFGSGIS